MPDRLLVDSGCKATGATQRTDLCGAVEGPNHNVNVVTIRSDGFRTANVAKLALLHNLGQLPEPKSAHTFC